jgi:hypothetical protein
MKHSSRVSKVVVFLLALALPAIAGKPYITVSPFVSYFIPASAGCGFDTAFVPEPGKPNGERIIEFANSEIIAGPLFAIATNLSTGKSINLNISGPGTLTFTSTGLTASQKGPEVGYLPANLAGPAGLPLVYVANGLAVYQYDSSGIVSASFKGEAQDLCQMLQ